MTDFAKAVNTRLEEIDSPLQIDRTEDNPGDAKLYNCTMTHAGMPAPHVAMVAAHDGQSVMVLCEMDAAKACDGLVAYSAAIDVVMGWGGDIGAKKRNDILRRLHLFDGGLAMEKPLKTQSGGTRFLVRKNTPSKGLMSFLISCNH